MNRRFGVSVLKEDYDLSDGEDFETTSIGAENITIATVSIDADTVAGTTKSFEAKLQGSLDGDVWIDVGSAITGADTADQTVGAVFTDLAWKYLRVAFDGDAAITGGTLNIKLGYVC